MADRLGINRQAAGLLAGVLDGVLLADIFRLGVVAVEDDADISAELLLLLALCCCWLAFRCHRGTTP